MDITTGQTVYENVFSLDIDGMPVTGATFEKNIFLNGNVVTNITLTASTINSSTGVFVTSFVPIEYGMHQYTLKNSITNVSYISDIYNVVPSSEIGQITVYVGM